MTQDELRQALLDALFEYEVHKKKRRLKSLKKALHGTVMATVIGSAGFTLASSERNNQLRDTATVTLSSQIPSGDKLNKPDELTSIARGVAFFAFNQYTLTTEHKSQLLAAIRQLPKDAEIVVRGHTDASGVKAYNKRLGKLRAFAVSSFLSQHGIKVKGISYQIANHNKNSWLERRVDLVVTSNKPKNVSPISSEIMVSKVAQKTDVIRKTPKPLTPIETKKNSVTKINTKPSILGTENLRQAVNSTDPIKQENTQPFTKQRQQVYGVLHFGVDQHTLTMAHRERLLEFMKQLPKYAELTIVGRTDPSGADNYNTVLGMERAKNTAIFLSYLGVKVKALASKTSKNMPSGWLARRVDIIVETFENIEPILLTKPFDNTQAPTANSLPVDKNDYVESIKAIKPSRLKAIENNVDHAIDNARQKFNQNYAK
jgi:outer membrane protein OmpA-like peptidoglycan-associated protein